jgi:hypothetical protein
MTSVNLKRLVPTRTGWQAGLSSIFVAAGFVVIAVAWNGAATKDFTQGQIPYLLSGGAAGLGLIAVGIGLMLFESSRRASAHLDRQMNAILAALESMRPAGSASSNGQASLPEGFVVAGATSYHRPDCRLVSGKSDQMVLSADDAATRGLAPCRVCNPEPSPAEAG